MTRTAITAAAVALAAALAAPVAAQAANPLHDHHAAKGAVPKVIVKGSKRPLSLKQAKEAQDRAARTGKFPPAPRLATNRGLRRTDSREISTRIRRNVAATEIPVVNSEPTTIDPKLFGFQGTYDAKRWSLLNWVNYTYSSVLGRTFRQPTVYELSGPGTTPDGCGTVSNAMFCWGNMNTVAWSAPFMRNVFNQFGDAAFASVLAHEYGHGAMSWLGFAGKGSFRYQIYREGFADCMAGAWLYWMSYYRYTDNVGAGDRNELYNLMFNLGSSNASTTYDNHGDAAWRTSLSTYGFNNGFNGCINWGRQLAAA